MVRRSALEDRLGEVLALGDLVEDVLAVDVLAGVLDVVLGRGDLVAWRSPRWPSDERSCDSCLMPAAPHAKPTRVWPVGGV